MASERRSDPAVPLVASALALASAAIYLWLVKQKGDGRFEPAWWFVALTVLGAAGAATGALLRAPRQRVAFGSTAVTLLAAAALSLQTMETSHGWALFGSVALPLLGAGGLCALGAWRPARRALLPAGVAALLLAVALPAARYLASHGEGIAGG